MALARTSLPSSKWDAIVEGEWYVPTINATAYGVDARGNHLEVGFQNVYNMHIVNGHFKATTISAIAFPDGPKQFNWQSSIQPVALMTGNIDDSGKITMTITSQPDTDNPVQNAVGQMLFLDGQWRMTMQVALVGASLKAPFIVQWANMTKFNQDISNLPPVTRSSKKLLQSQDYNWLQGTQWRVQDSQLPTKDIIFNINEFDSGYFFGSSKLVPANKDKGAFPRGVDSNNKQKVVDKISLSGDVSPAGQVFFAFTTRNGDISKAYGQIDGKSRGPSSIVLKDVITGEVVGDAKLVGKTHDRWNFARSYSDIVNRSCPSKFINSQAKTDKLAVHGSARSLASIQPFTALATPNPETTFEDPDWPKHSGAPRSAFDPFMMAQQPWHH